MEQCLRASSGRYLKCAATRTWRILLSALYIYAIGQAFSVQCTALLCNPLLTRTLAAAITWAPEHPPVGFETLCCAELLVGKDKCQMSTVYIFCIHITCWLAETHLTLNFHYITFNVTCHQKGAGAQCYCWINCFVMCDNKVETWT